MAIETALILGGASLLSGIVGNVMANHTAEKNNDQFNQIVKEQLASNRQNMNFWMGATGGAVGGQAPQGTYPYA